MRASLSILVLTIVFGSLVLVSLPAAARQNIVIGSLALGFDYWERDYDQDSSVTGVDPDSGDKRDYVLRPEITISSLDVRDRLTFRYAPVLRYDDLDSSTDVDHYLELQGERSMSRAWRLAVGDVFVLSDDSERYGAAFDAAEGEEGDGTGGDVEATETEVDEITRDRGRRRYWTNALSLRTGYAYGEDSELGLRYGYRVLRNESDDAALEDYDEYDRHELTGSIGHAFSPAVKSKLALRYVSGLYDEQAGDPSQDLDEYGATLGVDYRRGAADIFPLLYNYLGTRYDDDTRADTELHELTAGWHHGFDKHSRLNVGGGPSYVDADDLEGEWGYNAYLGLEKDFQHGRLGFMARKRYDPRNFTGGSDTGLTDMTDLRLDGSWRLTPDVTASGYLRYRYEDIIDPQGVYYDAGLGAADPASEQSVDDVTYSRESYGLGVRVKYTFLRWYAATLGYSYFNQDGDLARDDYSDHRVTLMLSYSMEFWRD